MIKKNQQNHLRDERNILADGCEWIVKLLYSFQDQTYLYLVMEFLVGGDLMTLLI
jgi:protein-serine/threonine kinase